MTKAQHESATRYPLSSFDPRYKKLLLAAALRTFVLTFKDKKLAGRFQRRMNTYRSKCKKEKVAGYELLYRCRSSRIDNKEGGSSVLTISPQEEDFEDAWNQINMGSDVPKQEPVEVAMLGAESETSNLDESSFDFLNQGADDK